MTYDDWENLFYVLNEYQFDLTQGALEDATWAKDASVMVEKCIKIIDRLRQETIEREKKCQTYAYQIDGTEDVFEVVHKITLKRPETVKELFKIMERKVPDGYDPKGKVTRLINFQGAFSINGPGVYSPGLK